MKASVSLRAALLANAAIFVRHCERSEVIYVCVRLLHRVRNDEHGRRSFLASVSEAQRHQLITLHALMRERRC
jgi:hypothetical protein